MTKRKLKPKRWHNLLPKDPKDHKTVDRIFEMHLATHEYRCPGFVIQPDEDKFFIYGVCSDCDMILEKHCKM